MRGPSLFCSLVVSAMLLGACTGPSGAGADAGRVSTPDAGRDASCPAVPSAAALGLPAPPVIALGGLGVHMLADVDGDCRLDLAVVDEVTGTVGLSLGLDGARFAPAGHTDVGSAPRAVVAIDVDGDGRSELAVARPDAHEVVLVGVTIGGGIGLSVSTRIALAAAPYALASADLDGDGDADLAVATASFPATGQRDGTESVYVLASNGGVLGEPREAWSWRGAPVGDAPTLLARDLDGDGDTDLVVADPTPVVVLRNLGAGTFEDVAASVGEGPVAVADVDADGIVDVVSMATAALVLWPGVGDMHYASIEAGYAPPGRLDWVAAAELDGLPGSEIAVGFLQTIAHGATRAGVETMTLGTDGEFAPSPGPFLTTGETSALWIGAGDLDRDGRTDLVAVRDALSSVALLNDHGALAWAAELEPTASPPGELVLADLDADGHLDAITTGTSDGAVFWGDAVGGLGAPVALALAGAQRIAAGDLDGDGHLDVVAAHTDATGLMVLRQSAARLFDAGTAIATPAPATRLVLSDVDGDGHLDAIVGSSGGVDVLRGAGDGTLAAATRAVSTAVGEALVVTDLDGDHAAELVASAAAGEIWIATNDGSGGFAAPATATLSLPPTAAVASIGAADLDGDGATDLVVLASDPAGARVLAWRNDGAFAPARVTVSESYADARTLALGDVDGDGRPDAVLAGGGRAVVVLVGQRDGTLAWGGAFPVEGDLTALALGDLDGDGRRDAVGASGGALRTMSSRRW